MPNEKEMNDLLEFENKMLKQKNQQMLNMKIKVDEEVFKLLYERVLLEVQAHLNKMEMQQNALLAMYANKVDPKRFPISKADEQEAIEIIKIGFGAFLDGLKSDAERVEEANKRMSDEI